MHAQVLFCDPPPPPQQPEPRAEEKSDLLLVEIVGLLRAEQARLSEIAALLSADQSNLSVGGLRIGNNVGNSPSWGMRRRIISSGRALGHDNFIVAAATMIQLCGHSPGRIAGSIVNTGGNPATVYLCEAGDTTYQAGGKFAGWLAPQGSFDFLVSDKVWTGPVTVYSPLGTTLAWGAV